LENQPDEESKLILETKLAEKEKVAQELENVKMDLENYYSEEYGSKSCWNKSVFEQPEALNFWFDFLDSEGELDQFSVKSIGCRPKAVNDKDVKAIYFRETPGVLFLNPDEWSEYSN
jgi:hypothetical protein